MSVSTLIEPAAPPLVTSKSGMPPEVWLLTLCAFAIGTAEFVIAGLLTQISSSLHVSEGQAGYLIIAFALAVVVAISSSLMRVDGNSKAGMADLDRAEDHVDIVVAA